MRATEMRTTEMRATEMRATEMRILLIRTSSLGDIVQCLPTLRTLRQGLPEAKIAWVVEQPFAPLLDGDPDLDQIIIVRLRTWRKSFSSGRTWREMRASLKEIRAFEADVVLDLMGSHKGGALAALSGCSRRVGLKMRQRREPSSTIWINDPVQPRGHHEVERALSVLLPLGLEPHFYGFGPEKIFPPGEADRASAETDSYIVIHPGAAWNNKRYPTAGWGQVARHLNEATGWPILVSTGPGEEHLLAELEASSGGAAAGAEAGSLESLASLLRGARLVLGGDTGPLHLAHALGTPALFVHGPTDPEIYGPYGAPDQVLAVRLPCSFCHKRYEDAQACLVQIPPQEIAESALALVTGEVAKEVTV